MQSTIINVARENTLQDKIKRTLYQYWKYLYLKSVHNYNYSVDKNFSDSLVFGLTTMDNSLINLLL